MENKYLVYQLASYLGTPSFYNIIGELIKKETNSEKIVIVRSEKNKWIILDSKGYNPKKLDFDTLEELMIELEDVNILKFPFNTYLLFDGSFEDKMLIRILNMVFDKEEEIYEKYRLEMVVDRLSYQLSGIESIVKLLSKKMDEKDFMDTLLGSISEIFFSTVGLYSQDKKLLKKFGKLSLPDEIELFEGMNEGLINGKSYNIFNFTDEEKAYYEVFNIKYITPYSKNGELKYILVISRDTVIEKEESDVFETVQKITRFFFEENAI
ncbi:hypothetical protein SAMN02745164_00716 [Marinitoga hydrogenitolerans DSM 16785]|uniref:Uncharacterized protein n=1 Tax=Marinitoga hydrogenitolerans (strain DSM 16785 / JCM 12826 / AT1271) TaxID=1122195 RepID=A0A1M4UL24_MARH1|nr:hypothetical protein [Marinitoga hydrogenitolerans]SHE57355.1 hypothetical protein SAMN02745164_00716 [Marinitoga hydrogenitolerans DSM 16785]